MKKKKRLTILDKAEIAMKVAIKKLYAQHKISGKPLYIWKDNKVKKIFVK